MSLPTCSTVYTTSPREQANFPSAFSRAGETMELGKKTRNIPGIFSYQHCRLFTSATVFTWGGISNTCKLPVSLLRYNGLTIFSPPTYHWYFFYYLLCRNMNNIKTFKKKKYFLNSFFPFRDHHNIVIFFIFFQVGKKDPVPKRTLSTRPPSQLYKTAHFELRDSISGNGTKSNRTNFIVQLSPVLFRLEFRNATM